MKSSEGKHMKSIDQQLTDLGTDLRDQLSALYADHLERLDAEPSEYFGGLSRVTLWKVYKEKREAAGAAYDAAYFALFPRRSRAK